MKSNLLKAFILSSLFLLSSVSVQAMGGFYEPDSKVVTTEEKINHYLFYLANQSLPKIAQSGLKKAVPDIFERMVVDGARMFIPDLLGAKTSAQKKLVHIGIDGVRQAVQASSQIKQYVEQQGQKIKRSDAIRFAFSKFFVPNLAKALTVNLMYACGSKLAHSIMQRFGYQPETVAASPFTFMGGLYQQARQKGYSACQTAFEAVFGY